MKLVFIVLLIFFCNLASAAPTLISVGLGRAPHWTSEEINFGQNPYLKMNSGLILRVDVEQNIWSKLSIFFGGDYLGQSGVGYYDYFNRTEGITLTQADIKMLATQVIVRGGFRTYFSFIYLGAGGILGNMGLSWDEEQFRANNGTALGFKAEDSRSLMGSFYEAGLRFVFKKWGIRIGYSTMLAATGPFETLHDTKIKLKETHLTAGFIIVL